MNKPYKKIILLRHLKIWSFFAISLIGVIMAFIFDSHIHIFLNLAGFALCLSIFFCILSVVEIFMLILEGPFCCLHPYFERELPKPAKTFFQGRHLAKVLDTIDSELKKRGILSISSFGYKDSILNSGCDWFDASLGLTTFYAALEIAEGRNDWLEVVNEIKKIIDALKLANAAGIRFCMHMRTNSAFSGQELANREGSYS